MHKYNGQIPMSEYKRPILSSVYSVCGALYGIVLSGAGAFILIQSPDKIKDIGLALCLILSGLMVIIVFFGIAQIFDFIGKTAFYAEKIAKGNPPSAKSDSESNLLLMEKLEELKDEQEKTNKLLEEFLGRLQ
jgi:hypothetical protein